MTTKNEECTVQRWRRIYREDGIDELLTAIEDFVVTQQVGKLRKDYEQTSRITAADIGDNHKRLRVVEDRLLQLTDRMDMLAHDLRTVPREHDAPQGALSTEEEWADVALEGSGCDRHPRDRRVRRS